MFISVKTRKGKNSERYNVYKCRKVDGKRSDTFILSLSKEQIADGSYKEIIKKEVPKELQQMVFDKLPSFTIPKSDTFFVSQNDMFADCWDVVYGGKVIYTIDPDILKFKGIERITNRTMGGFLREYGDMDFDYDLVEDKIRKLIKLLNKDTEIERLQLENNCLNERIVRLTFENHKRNNPLGGETSLTKEQYRLLSKFCHPDNGGSDEAMKILNSLYNG